MALVKFRYVTKDRDRHGNVRFYFRRPGKPKIRLRGLPGSEEFLNAYKAALGETDRAAGKAARSFDWLCHQYYKSAQFRSLEDYTQRRKRAVLDEISNIVGARGRRLGSAPFSELKKVHVRKLRDMKAATPEAANFRLKQISALYAWAIKNDLATFNPAEKLEKLEVALKVITPGRIRMLRHSRHFGRSARNSGLPCRSCYTLACGARTPF